MCIASQAGLVTRTPQRAAPHTLSLTLFYFLFVSPVLKNASMSPASFAVSSAPSPELMAATDLRLKRTVVPPINRQGKVAPKKSLPARQRCHCGQADSYGDSHTANGAICGSPSLGVVVVVDVTREHRVPLREWSRGLGEAGEGWEGPARRVLGRLFVSFRKRARRTTARGFKRTGMYVGHKLVYND